MAAKKLWNEGWEFCEQELDEKNKQIPQNALFQKVDIPHDYMIYDVHHLYRDSIGWYHKEFQMEKPGPEEEICLRFDGVYMDTAVFVNGSLAGEWKYGYSTFEMEITPLLKSGLNEVYVRVVYQSLNTRWYSGAGIYRNIWWKSRNRDHVLSDGIYITPVRKNEADWKVQIATEIAIRDVQDACFYLKQTVLDSRGNKIGEDEKQIKTSGSQDKEPGRTMTVQQEIDSVYRPALWDIGQGNLYCLRTELWKNEKLLETEEQKFGFKTMEFLPDKGFFLNGRHVKINGVCEHHDFGCLGAAFSRAAARRKLILLRKMGVNAIRTSHNMPAPELMDLADEMGFLVNSEAFDMWEKPKTTYDYARFFNEWFEKDVEAWVRRDRNRASLMMWSIGNEIQDTLVPERGVEITKALRDAVRKYDYQSHAPVTLGSNFLKWENPQKCADELDCVGYNYSEYLYDQHHKEHENWIIYGSETASILSSRGIYHFPIEKSILTDEDEQCSALGNSITGWGAKSYEACIGDDRDASYSMGQFLWTGFDYIGESTPYETKNSYFGQIDTAGFPKDAFYIFQSEWTDYHKDPMVHVFPYWDFGEGQDIDVQVCSNAPAVELFVNGRSIGKHKIDHGHGRDQIGRWKVPYEKGEITAIAYDENGKEIARKSRRSFGDACRITAQPDKLELQADGQDMTFVEISVCDREGNPVENAKNRIHVEVTGAGRLLGLDNGDSADFDEYKGKSRRLFGGKLLAVIGSKKQKGEVNITLSSPGMETYKLVLQAVDSPCPEGVAAKEENKDVPVYGGGSKGKLLALGEGEIPVRKLELILEGDPVLSKEQPEITVRAIIYPENTSYRELEWRATNDTGIDVNYVELLPEGNTVKVLAEGDGRFWLKCFARNGGSGVSVQSAIELKAEGIGKAFLNPYEEIPAGLCEYRSEQCGEGIEHGIGFLGTEDGEGYCVAGFTSLNFGDFGTDEITLPIFANTNHPVTFQIWEGNPEEVGSEMLADCYYFKPPQWMVFQEESYKLSHRIRGNAQIYIVTAYNFQLRGIYFKKEEKAYTLLKAAECDRIYGDVYRIQEDKVEQIGNNVTLEFENMDFGEQGTNEITICYRSVQELNPVQIRFTGEGMGSIQVVEADLREDYGEQTFRIETLTGKGKLEFIFLPGSCFDFHWFQFKKISNKEEK